MPELGVEQDQARGVAARSIVGRLACILEIITRDHTVEIGL